MTNLKKKIFLILFLILTFIANVSFASYSTVQMSVVEEPVATVQLGTNSKFEKKLVSKDLKNKEVTIQLQVTNNEKNLKPTGELVLVLDNSKSMTNKINSDQNTTRHDVVFKSAQSLITNLLKDNNDLKISVVSFSTNVDVSKEGTLSDASVVSKLSNDSTAINSAIDSIQTNGPRTDLESGLTLGAQQFSKDATNKYMVVLTDGVPNVSIGHNNPYYSDDVINATKAKLQSISKSGITLSTMLTGIDDESYVPSGTSKNFGQIITEVFGTSSNPTAGKFYYVTDDKAEQTIKTEIYNSLLPVSQSYKNITVTDYFPEEIINNFDFSYVEKANVGNISAEVDKKNNSITWTIPELASGKTATVQYKLKLKQDFDSKIVNKILNTNEKVDITYDDFNNKHQSKTTDITPKLKLVEPETPVKNETPKPTTLPKAGASTILGISVAVLSIIAIVSFVRYKYYNKNMK